MLSAGLYPSRWLCGSAKACVKALAQFLPALHVRLSAHVYTALPAGECGGYLTEQVRLPTQLVRDEPVELKAVLVEGLVGSHVKSMHVIRRCGIWWYFLRVLLC